MGKVIKDQNSVAVLSNTPRYSTFSFGDMCIKFKTSPNLLHYKSIIKWNNGYIECLAVYKTFPEPLEEYIDLRYIAKRLELPDDIFKTTKEVIIK